MHKGYHSLVLARPRLQLCSCVCVYVTRTNRPWRCWGGMHM